MTFLHFASWHKNLIQFGTACVLFELAAIVTQNFGIAEF